MGLIRYLKDQQQKDPDKSHGSVRLLLVEEGCIDGSGPTSTVHIDSSSSPSMSLKLMAQRTLRLPVLAAVVAFGLFGLSGAAAVAPLLLPGGFPLPEGVAKTPASMSYADAAKVPAQWALPAVILQVEEPNRSAPAITLIDAAVSSVGIAPS